MDAWQQQCCGDDFRVGSDVEWSLVATVGPDAWIDLLLGAEWAELVGYREEHHTEGEQIPVVVGRVESIREVTCSRTLEPDGSGQVLVPVPGSGVLKEVVVADPWKPEPPARLRGQITFDGWIVELALDR